MTTSPTLAPHRPYRKWPVKKIQATILAFLFIHPDDAYDADNDIIAKLRAELNRRI